MKRSAIACTMLVAALATIPVCAAEDDARPPREVCDAHLENVFAALEDGRYDAAVAEFGDALRTRYPASRLGKDYTEPTAKYGRVVARGRPHTSRVGSDFLALTPLMLEHATFTITARCDASGTVTAFRIEPTEILSSH